MFLKFKILSEDRFVKKRYIFDVMLRIFVNGAFGLIKSRLFHFILLQGDAGSYYFAQTVLLFHVNLHGPDFDRKEFSFLQCFEATSAVDRTDRGLNCV